mmetsp:Transcript_25719/g.59452  ORF Transcript_25719/g.59452 Transcript_25719/m.59452 type:complete len:207 (+) Transcript_25719:123-743(+)
MAKLLDRCNARITCVICITFLTSLALSSPDGDAEACVDDGADTIVAKMLLLQTGWEVAPHSNNADAGDATLLEAHRAHRQRGKVEPDAADLVAEWAHSAEDVLHDAAQIPLDTFRDDLLDRNLSLAAKVGAPPAAAGGQVSQFTNFTKPSRYIALAIIFICAIAFYMLMSYVCDRCIGSQDMKQELEETPGSAKETEPAEVSGKQS